MDRFAALVARPGTRMASVQHSEPGRRHHAERGRVRATGAGSRRPVPHRRVPALAHLPLDARALGVDLLSISSRKAYGPSGAGALFARRGLSPDTLLRGRDRHAAPTLGLPALAGMAAALTAMRPRVADLAGTPVGLSQRLRAGPGGLRTRARARHLARPAHRLRRGVRRRSRDTVHDPGGPRHPGRRGRDRRPGEGRASSGRTTSWSASGSPRTRRPRTSNGSLDVLPDAVERLRGMAARAATPTAGRLRRERLGDVPGVAGRAGASSDRRHRASPWPAGPAGPSSRRRRGARRRGRPRCRSASSARATGAPARRRRPGFSWCGLCTKMRSCGTDAVSPMPSVPSSVM